MGWTQDYTPLGNSLLLSSLAALIPILYFFLGSGNQKNERAYSRLDDFADRTRAGRFRIRHARSAGCDVGFARRGLRAAADRLDYRDFSFFVQAYGENRPI